MNKSRIRILKNGDEVIERKITTTATLTKFLTLSDDPLDKKQVGFQLNSYLDAWEQHPPVGSPDQIANSIAVATDALIQIDKQAQSIEPHITCRDGCAHCCKQAVAVTSVEAARLLAHARATGVELDRAKIEEQATYSNDEEWIARPTEKRTCVFLGADNRCRVYRARPAACRKYFSIENPDACDIDKYPGGEFMQWFSMKAEILTSAAYTYFESGYLPVMLLAEIRKERPREADQPSNP